ncbi:MULTISPECIES: ATPase [unclassified Pseudomonas]|uniref:ATPase n=1 Tax=unclassified Pseudomonas TaxID=196821 RepID=UPI002AC8AAE6|nr:MULTISPECIES: ATPase [unclassified Pseudomonas]MEB0048575.1 ATPase [Pseudomonas sp. Dout3]MEB0097577.1 ATPase [Pseudomonas sp. DC1.2]WPX56766.1 ATPase [Pseudomonas sp. DC1.2]
MKLPFVSTLTLATLLAGCSVPTAPQAVSSPDTLLNPAAGHASVMSVTHGASVALGIVYSPSTQTNRAYLADYQANAGTGFGQSLLVRSIHDAYVSTSRPDLAVDWVKASLQHQFGSVTVYPDLQSLRAAKPQVVAIITTHSQLITSRSSDITADVSAEFYDSKFNYIGTAQGHDAQSLSPVWADFKRSEEMVADINKQQDVQVRALQKFDQSLSNLLTRSATKVSMIDSAVGQQ